MAFCHNHVSDRQYIGIGIYSKDGELLAWRSATFAKESRLNYMAIEDTMIRYSDDPLNQRDSPADCILHMPPTWVDWLEARMPGGIPGVNHCGQAPYEVVNKALDQWDLRVETQRQKRSEQGTAPSSPGAPASR